jgi:hypothetical protein
VKRVPGIRARRARGPGAVAVWWARGAEAGARGATAVVAPLARRARGPRALVGLLAGLAVALVAAAAVVLGGAGHPARTGATAPGATPVPGSGTRAARWLGGPAGRLLSAVNADLGQLAVAERSGKPGPARLAGQRLTADAKAALLGPAPPLAARLYRAALAELERAGRGAAAGRLRAADASLRAGESTITKATAVANSPATAGVPAGPGTGPAGQ